MSISNDASRWGLFGFVAHALLRAAFTLFPETTLSRSCRLVRGLNHPQAELMRPLEDRSNLLFAVPGFVECHAFIHVLLPVLQQPVKQARPAGLLFEVTAALLPGFSIFAVGILTVASVFLRLVKS